MENNHSQQVTVTTRIMAPVESVWKMWSDPEHITKWNQASDDWQTPRAENDLRPGGKFSSRMEAKDGSAGFDFEGVYDIVDHHKRISYSMQDGRKVDITFTQKNGETTIIETFDAETTNPVEMQQQGWQQILDNFKKHVESTGKEMHRLHYEIVIDAPTGKVFKMMLAPDSYPTWTALFHPSSRYEGSWEKGGKLLFIGEEKDGERGGMVGIVEENIPNKFVSVRHIGLVHNDQEITSGPQVEGWAGAHENYSFTDVNGKTKLEIDVDVNRQWMDYFDQTWPKALNKLKEICEN